MSRIVNCFVNANDKITSDNNDLTSNEVLAVLRPYFESIGFTVECGKSKEDKIDVPVLFGVNNKVDKSFYADAISKDGKIVIEVEAGQATENHRFLKDIFEACMMFDRVYTFLETLYVSNRLHLPLTGILLIGY